MIQGRIKELLRQGCANPFGVARCPQKGGGNTTATTINYSPEEAAQREKVMQEAFSIYGNTKDGIANSPYPGAAPVPFSPETQWAQNYLSNYAQGPAIQQAANINNAVGFGLSDVLNVNSNPHLQGAIQAGVRPIVESYMDPDGIMSSIRTGAGQAGQYGSSRQGIAEGVAAGRMLNAVGDKASTMASDAYSRGLDTFEKTMMFAPTALQTGYAPAQLMDSVGAQKEAWDQAMAAFNTESQLWDLNSQWQPLNNLANIVYGGGSSMTQTNSSIPNSRNPLLGALGGGMMGWQMGSAGGMLSSIGGPAGMIGGALLGALLS